jgi:hypothetical protein
VIQNTRGHREVPQATIQQATDKRCSEPPTMGAAGYREVLQRTGSTKTRSKIVRAATEHQRPLKGFHNTRCTRRCSQPPKSNAASHQEAMQPATKRCSEPPRRVPTHWEHRNAQRDSKSHDGKPEPPKGVPKHRGHQEAPRGLATERSSRRTGGTDTCSGTAGDHALEHRGTERSGWLPKGTAQREIKKK